MQILQMKNVSEAMNFDDVEIKTWDTVVNNTLIRDRTLSMQEGVRRVFGRVLKYFRHILMGHEILLEIFDGPQNIFHVLF